LPIVLTDLVPGLALRYELESTFGTEIGEGSIAPLRPREHRTMDIVIDRAGHDLHCRVLDDAGVPLVGAAVSIHFPARNRPGIGSGIASGTDQNGNIVLKGIYTDTVDLSVRKEGFVPLRVSDLVVPRDDSLVTLRLERGLDVEVTVQLESGQPVQGSVNGHLDSGAVATGVELAPGRFLIRGLPDDVITIRAVTVEATVDVRHDSGIPTLSITLPDPGNVEATLRLRPDASVPPTGCALLLVPGLDPRDSRARRRWIDLRTDPRSSRVSASIPDVLPGRYSAVLAEAGETGEPRKELTPRVEIEVESRSTTQVAIGP